jgi:hypothetical protein
MIVLQDAVLHGLGNDSAEWDEVIAHGGLRYGAPIKNPVSRCFVYSQMKRFFGDSAAYSTHVILAHAGIQWHYCLTGFPPTRE